ncbi:hypothetical protein SNE40_002314 [Patella caerulea]|uniref:EF-hand domain-containing protein n=1 Tax=Patella caerulea TaxID=87958 RepID=A0AAN8KFB4_PATCE
MVEYAEIRDHFDRIYTNGDGEISQEELANDSVGEGVSSPLFKLYDVNGDGKITWTDAKLFYFELGREYGNDIDLEEHLEYFLSQTESEDSGITVEAFVRARRNFLAMDSLSMIT